MAAGCLLLLGACAKRPPKKPKPKRPEVSIPAPEAPPVPAALQPKREASQRIVQMGQNYLMHGELDKAVQSFQEAINVDPENGVAYFYMARALYQTAAYEDALGLLDRADTLLSPYPDWHDEVMRLRFMIEEAKQAPPEGEPEKEDEGYY